MRGRPLTVSGGRRVPTDSRTSRPSAKWPPGRGSSDRSPSRRWSGSTPTPSYTPPPPARPTRSRPAAFLPGAGKNGHRRRPVTLAAVRTEVRVLRYSRWYETDRRLDRYFQQWFRSLGQRRVTAISLAAQLYRADHGRWPARLEELVPAYLPVLPADPFHADGRPVGYVVMKGALPDGSDRPLAYFDDGATDHVAIDPEPMYDWQQDQRPDGTASHRDIRQYRDLARWLPPKRRFDTSHASEPKTVGDHPDQPDAPGDDAQKNNDPKD